jgi:hypothetical protein
MSPQNSVRRIALLALACLALAGTARAQGDGPHNLPLIPKDTNLFVVLPLGLSGNFNPSQTVLIPNADVDVFAVPLTYVRTFSLGGRPADGTLEARRTGEIDGSIKAKESSPGSLAGVWATRNTRAAIWDALAAREAFVTSGPRIKPRFFGRAGLVATDAGSLVKEGYAKGVPMGGILKGLTAAPTFAVAAQKDPKGANLDRNTVHAYTPRAVRQAIEAGVKCIDHGQLLDEPTARLMAEKGVWWSLQPFLDDRPSAYAEGSPNRVKQLEMSGAVLKSGAPSRPGILRAGTGPPRARWSPSWPARPTAAAFAFATPRCRAG